LQPDIEKATIMSTRPPHVYAVIPGHNPSFAWLSSANSALVKRAVIFVHGFSGKAASTWMDFYRLIDNPTAASPWWETVDLYFFDYERQSIFSQISRNTLTLMNFLDFIWPKPDPAMASILAGLQRPDDFEYEDITLVGHSEGGLLIRKVILETARHNQDIESYRLLHDRTGKPEPVAKGLLKADLRLFAPAIAGESISGILGLIAGLPFIKPITGISAAKLGLAPIAIPVTSARKATDDYTEYLSMSCFRAHILWADDENIVTSEPYQRDHACRNLPAKSDHPSVCKPNWRYLLPLSFVEKGVVNGQCK
jgi:hypothetical protein